MTVKSRKLEKVNLGCGPNAPADWLNVDGSWNAWFSHHRQLRKALETVGLINPNLGAQWAVRPWCMILQSPCHSRNRHFQPFTPPTCWSTFTEPMRKAFC